MKLSIFNYEGAFLIPVFGKLVRIIEKIQCPFCGYEMPIYKDKNAIAKCVYVKCKGRNCKRLFEINIENKKIK